MFGFTSVLPVIILGFLIFGAAIFIFIFIYFDIY
jgi:hypothetical protein